MGKRKEYKMVRLSKATHTRLLEVVAGIIAKEAKELGITRFVLSDRISLDKAITVLLDRRDAHSARSAKSAEKRRSQDVDNVDNVDNKPIFLNREELAEKFSINSGSQATPQEVAQCQQPQTTQKQRRRTRSPQTDQETKSTS